MKEWLKSKRLTKTEYIELLVFITVVWLATSLFDGMTSTPAGIGIVLGTVLSIIIWLGPIVLVDVKNIKVKRPRAKFVEPKQFKIALLYVSGIIIMAFVALMMATGIQLSGIESLMNAEGIVGSAIMMFLLLSILLAPITAYMLNAKIRYKRIVEYKTVEWKRLQK